MPSFLLRRSCGGRWRASDLSRLRRSRSLARCNWLLLCLPAAGLRQGSSKQWVHPDSLGVLAELALQAACCAYSLWVSKRQGALWRSIRGTPCTGACRHAWVVERPRGFFQRVCLLSAPVSVCLSVSLSVCLSVCLYVCGATCCVCVRACVRAFVRARVRACVRACMRMQAGLRTCVHVCVRLRASACVCVRVPACACVCLRVPACACVCLRAPACLSA